MRCGYDLDTMSICMRFLRNTEMQVYSCELTIVFSSRYAMQNTCILCIGTVCSKFVFVLSFFSLTFGSIIKVCEFTIQTPSLSIPNEAYPAHSPQA